AGDGPDRRIAPGGGVSISGTGQRTRIDELIEREERRFVERQPRSAGLAGRAERSLAGGVTSNWQIHRPQAVWIDRGQGSHIWDVDGNEFVDLHGGYGVNAVGHAHPA